MQLIPYEWLIPYMRISLSGVAVQEKVSAGDGRNDAFQNIDESYRASGFLGKASR